MKQFIIFSTIAILSMVASFFMVAATYGIAAHTGILTVVLGCGVFLAAILVILAVVSIMNNENLNDALFN